jgi:hypothetical protein
MCYKFNDFFNIRLFLLFFLFFLSSCFQVNAQNDNPIKITELNFPYQNNLVMTYTAKKVVFDNYNFPKETTYGKMNYDFHNYKPGILKVIYATHFQKDSSEYITYLQMNKSGLTFWFADNDSIKLKKHTLAISLPLYKGKMWSTYFNDKKSQVTCISVDTVISTPYGNLPVFVIKHLVHIKKKSTNLIDYNIAFTEFYNQKYGKVKMNILEYGRMKENNRIIKFREEENTISTFTAPEIK